MVSMGQNHNNQGNAGGSNERNDQHLQTFFVRALYDYDGTDVNTLSFRRGDIIEVLTQLPSGWWDGLLGNNRAWFPSNYVRPISEAEAGAWIARRMNR